MPKQYKNRSCGVEFCGVLKAFVGFGNVASTGSLFLSVTRTLSGLVHFAHYHLLLFVVFPWSPTQLLSTQTLTQVFEMSHVVPSNKNQDLQEVRSFIYCITAKLC